MTGNGNGNKIMGMGGMVCQKLFPHISNSIALAAGVVQLGRESQHSSRKDELDNSQHW